MRKVRKARGYGRGVAGVLMVGGDRPGLHAPAAARGLRLVHANDPEAASCRVALHLSYRDELASAGRIALHIVRGGEAAVVRALDAGADDAVAISASDVLIAARLAALVRRSGDGHAVIRIGELVIDRLARRVTRAGRVLPLLPREYELLLALAVRPGITTTRAELHAAVFRLRFEPGTNVLAVHVSRLRAKLDRGFGAPMLLTVKGVGYRLVAADPARG